VEVYRDENEQVEALRRWWSENGRSIVIGVVLALGLGFGWQGWQKYSQEQADAASDIYQAMIQNIALPDSAAAAELAQRLKSEFGSTTYAQFAALHLAADAVNAGELTEAQAQLRWVLGKASQGSDMAQVAQLRLARVLAAAGENEQALAILAETPANAYRAAYAVARGDVLRAQGERDAARQAYSDAQALLAQNQMGVNPPSLAIKLQALTPVPARSLEADASETTTSAADAATEGGDATAAEGEG